MILCQVRGTANNLVCASVALLANAPSVAVGGKCRQLGKSKAVARLTDGGLGCSPFVARLTDGGL